MYNKCLYRVQTICIISNDGKSWVNARAYNHMVIERNRQLSIFLSYLRIPTYLQTSFYFTRSPPRLSHLAHSVYFTVFRVVTPIPRTTHSVFTYMYTRENSRRVWNGTPGIGSPGGRCGSSVAVLVLLARFSCYSYQSDKSVCRKTYTCMWVRLNLSRLTESILAC